MMIKGLACALALSLFTAANAEVATVQVTGEFDVKLSPQGQTAGIEAAKISRMTIDKHFRGDLAAHSLGEMLAVRTATTGSAGYVAMERVEGSLNGRKGSFVLQHSGSMNRGLSSLTLSVVPDSGEGELTGLVGTMTIDIKDGKHRYTFDYQLQ